MATPSHNLHIVALLSTERGRRNAMFSSVQCLLSVVGSMGIILLFAGIPQLIYSPVVTVTNVVTFLMGALLLSVMVAGNACIGYKFRTEIDEIRGVLRDTQATEVVIDDKPPNYDDLAMIADALPPDYYSVVTSQKYDRGGENSNLVEIVPTHSGRPSSRSSSKSNSDDNLQRLWEPPVAVEVLPRSSTSVAPPHVIAHSTMSTSHIDARVPSLVPYPHNSSLNTLVFPSRVNSNPNITTSPIIKSVSETSLVGNHYSMLTMPYTQGRGSGTFHVDPTDVSPPMSRRYSLDEEVMRLV